ncbi:MAG TPA: N-6 DNA methylase, partial [Pseudobdellovibrionaceae bacterium]|nr:N-6 DNA methylase [Pseudobdellovibrionaceae bacterium]
VKDAIVDQFRDKFGVRPDVEKHGADLVIQVRAVKNQFSLSVDLSGESLFKRGYRKEALEAPLKENLAAGLLRLAEWDRVSPIVDPMCGSGTILIEAAMMALNMAPGSHRKNFGFQNWLNFDEEAWEKVLDEAAETEKQDLDFKLFGFDIDRKAISIAKANAKVAGVDHVVEFKSEPVATLNPPVPEGMIVTNPPYGARIGDEDNLRDVYRDLSYTLKNRFPGWTAWILAGNKDLVSDLKLKSTRKFQVFNGNIECRLLKYEIQQR